MEQITRIGIDTSKNVFQLHGVNAEEKPILCKKLTRNKMIAFLKDFPPTVIAIEACGSAHHWARYQIPDACGVRRARRRNRPPQPHCEPSE